MQYFVSIENSNYFYWQIELLIESFKLKGLDDQLVIAIAENNSPKVVGPVRNLVEHQRKFIHHNYGDEKGLKQLNRLYALISALNLGMLKYPFTLIHADMVLFQPVQTFADANIVLHQIDDISQIVEPYVQKLAESNNLSRDQFPEKLPFGGTVIFQDVPSELFWRVMYRTERLFEEKGASFPCEKVAWSISLYEMIESIVPRGLFLECGLVEPIEKPDVNFIHYKHGIPPVFHKKYYEFDKINFALSPDPYSILLEHNPTPASNHLQSIINSYNSRSA